MKIVIDYQARQNSSRERGVGRVTYLLSKYIIKYIKGVNINFFVNKSFKKNLPIIKKELNNLKNKNNIIYWKPSANLSYFGKKYEYNSIRTNEIINKKLYKKKNQIIYIVTGLLDCLHENTYHFIKRNSKVKKVLIFHDLIPLKNPKKYLNKNTKFKKIYLKNINQVKNFDHIFAVSHQVRKDIIKYLKIRSSKVSLINLSPDPYFKKVNIPTSKIKKFKIKYKILGNFILYLGPTDERKNLTKLIEGFKYFKEHNSKKLQLFIVGRLGHEYQKYIKRVNEHNLEKDIIFTNYVNDEDARLFYNLTDLFIFPSKEEGFGLPIIEAMKCGANVICSNKKPMSDILSIEKNLFNPNDPKDIAQKISNNIFLGERKKIIIKSILAKANKYNWKTSISNFKNILNKI